jgi:hypothetical protein
MTQPPLAIDDCRLAIDGLQIGDCGLELRIADWSGDRRVAIRVPIDNPTGNPQSPLNRQSPFRESPIGSRQSLNRQSAIGNRK